MDLATQDFQDDACNVLSTFSSSTGISWGKLFSLNSYYSSVDLKNDRYVFGRNETCDIIFNCVSSDFYPLYSKEHFKIVREETPSGYFVFLYDTSSNGTFVNGKKVGKGKKILLNNNSSIELASKLNRVYIFIDMSASVDSLYPASVTDKYSVSNTLGRGACGEVKLVFKKSTCQRMAMKIISKKKFSFGSKHNPNTFKETQSEVNILKSLDHPNIIKIEDVIETDDSLFIVLELAEGGELFDRVISIGQFKESVAKLLCYQMILAVKYLHDKGITHRDLKPENILLLSNAGDDKTLLKVTDFGLSKFVDANTMLRTFCGTPNYLAPEVLKSNGNGSYSNQIDVWSLGVIFFICLVGYPPFTDERSDYTLNDQILGGHVDFPNEHCSSISQDAIDLIRQMLQVDSVKRINISEALEHVWFQDSAMRQTLAHNFKEHGIMGYEYLVHQSGCNGVTSSSDSLILRKRPATSIDETQIFSTTDCNDETPPVAKKKSF